MIYQDFDNLKKFCNMNNFSHQLRTFSFFCSIKRKIKSNTLAYFVPLLLKKKYDNIDAWIWGFFITISMLLCVSLSWNEVRMNPNPLAYFVPLSLRKMISLILEYFFPLGVILLLLPKKFLSFSLQSINENVLTT